MLVLRSLPQPEFDARSRMQFGFKADFHWTLPGDLLCLPLTCDFVSDWFGHTCGCERCFTGICNAKSTTIGRVSEEPDDRVRDEFLRSPFPADNRPASPDDLWQAALVPLGDALAAGGFQPGDLVRIAASPAAFILYPDSASLAQLLAVREQIQAMPVR